MNNLNYGVIGNCRSAALVSDKGSIDWCCLPDFDSPSIFAKLIDNEIGGSFSVEVSDDYKISQKYIFGTNVLCTEFRSDSGTFEVIDFMPRYKLTMKDHFALAEIYRYLKHISGAPTFKIVYQPAFNYAREEVSNVIEQDYIKTYSKEKPTDCIYLYTSLNRNDVLNSDEITITAHQFLLLSYNQKLVEIDIKRVYVEFQRTKVYWLD